MAVQTEKLQDIFREIIGVLEQISKSSQTYQAQLDQRLAKLPQAIAEGIRAEAIVAGINESLRQQFVQSTIPETGHALAVTATQIKRSSAEFAQMAKEIGNAYKGAAEEARQAIANLESTSSQAIAALQRQAANASHIFERGNRWSLCVLLAFALVSGAGLEKVYQRFAAAPEQQLVCAPVAQPALPSPHLPGNSKPKR